MVDTYSSTNIQIQSLREKSILQPTNTCHGPSSWLYSSVVLLMTASHLLGTLPRQFMIIFPQNFDCDDNEYNHVVDKNNGHRYD